MTISPLCLLWCREFSLGLCWLLVPDLQAESEISPVHCATHGLRTSNFEYYYVLEGTTKIRISLEIAKNGHKRVIGSKVIVKRVEAYEQGLRWMLCTSCSMSRCSMSSSQRVDVIGVEFWCYYYFVSLQQTYAFYECRRFTFVLVVIFCIHYFVVNLYTGTVTTRILFYLLASYKHIKYNIIGIGISI